MLMFVFGAGASFDSDPDRPPPGVKPVSANRPPLAPSLFEMGGKPYADAAEAFPRSSPMLMRLREATRSGRNVETVLEELQAEEDRYPATAAQLLALRGYLRRLLTDLPESWNNECVGQTNYVLALDEAARWAGQTGQPVLTVTFNYDVLLEQACSRVYGARFARIDQYQERDDLRVYKPHGSVDWAQLGQWSGASSFYSGEASLRAAIDDIQTITWTDTFAKRSYKDDAQDARDPSLLWVPALAIPVERKPALAMPAHHLDALRKDLANVSLMVAVGWRGRERHFLQILQDCLPSKPLPLVAVAESVKSAEETRDSLWETGRFDRYLLASRGFSRFVQSPEMPDSMVPPESRHPSPVTLGGVLSSMHPWQKQSPGSGLRLEPQPIAKLTRTYAPFTD